MFTELLDSPWTRHGMEGESPPSESLQDAGKTSVHRPQPRTCWAKEPEEGLMKVGLGQISLPGVMMFEGVCRMNRIWKVTEERRALQGMGWGGMGKGVACTAFGNLGLI